MSNRISYKVFGIRVIEYIVAAFFKGFTILPGKKRRKNVGDTPKILLCRLDHIGDVIMTTVALRAIKEKYPNATVSILTSKACIPLFEGNPFVNQCYSFNWPWPYDTFNNRFTIKHVKCYYKLYKELKREKFDIMIECRGDIRIFFLFGVLLFIPVLAATTRTGGDFLLSHPADYNGTHHELERVADVLKVLDIPVNRMRGELCLFETDFKATNQIIQEITGMNSLSYAVISPTAAKRVKEWIPFRWKEVADYIYLKHNCLVFFAGTKADEPGIDNLIGTTNFGIYNFAGKTTLRQLAALLYGAKIIIGVDTGTLHMGACFDVPVVSLFGPTYPQEFRPYTPFGKVIDLDICFCDRDKHLKCSKPEGDVSFCMNAISVKSVCETIDQLM